MRYTCLDVYKRQDVYCDRGVVKRADDKPVDALLFQMCIRDRPEGDQAGKGGDGRPEAADVGAEEQRPPVIREAGQKDGGGYVADDLAGERGGCLLYTSRCV